MPCHHPGRRRPQPRHPRRRTSSLVLRVGVAAKSAAADLADAEAAGLAAGLADAEAAAFPEKGPPPPGSGLPASVVAGWGPGLAGGSWPLSCPGTTHKGAPPPPRRLAPATPYCPSPAAPQDPSPHRRQGFLAVWCATRVARPPSCPHRRHPVHLVSAASSGSGGAATNASSAAITPLSSCSGSHARAGARGEGGRSDRAALRRRKIRPPRPPSTGRGRVRVLGAQRRWTPAVTPATACLPDGMAPTPEGAACLLESRRSSLGLAGDARRTVPAGPDRPVPPLPPTSASGPSSCRTSLIPDVEPTPAVPARS